MTKSKSKRKSKYAALQKRLEKIDNLTWNVSRLFIYYGINHSDKRENAFLAFLDLLTQVKRPVLKKEVSEHTIKLYNHVLSKSSLSKFFRQMVDTGMIKFTTDGRYDISAEFGKILESPPTESLRSYPRLPSPKYDILSPTNLLNEEILDSLAKSLFPFPEYSLPPDSYCETIDIYADVIDSVLEDLTHEINDPLLELVAQEMSNIELSGDIVIFGGVLCAMLGYTDLNLAKKFIDRILKKLRGIRSECAILLLFILETLLQTTSDSQILDKYYSKIDTLLDSQRRCGNCSVGKEWIYRYRLLLKGLGTRPEWLQTAEKLTNQLISESFPSLSFVQNFVNVLIDLAILHQKPSSIFKLLDSLFELFNSYSHDIYFPAIITKLCRKTLTEPNDPSFISLALELIPHLELKIDNQVRYNALIASTIYSAKMKENYELAEELWEKKHQIRDFLSKPEKINVDIFLLKELNICKKSMWAKRVRDNLLSALYELNDDMNKYLQSLNHKSPIDSEFTNVDSLESLALSYSLIQRILSGFIEDYRANNTASSKEVFLKLDPISPFSSILKDMGLLKIFLKENNLAELRLVDKSLSATLESYSRQKIPLPIPVESFLKENMFDLAYDVITADLEIKNMARTWYNLYLDYISHFFDDYEITILEIIQIFHLKLQRKTFGFSLFPILPYSRIIRL